MSSGSSNGARPLGIGLVGANPDRGWAISSHLPALTSGILADRARLVAVGTSREETAQRAAVKFNARGYGDYRRLIADPEVDIVVVSVKLPLHHEIVSAALAAGKHVFCEWPLGRTLEESEDLAKRAEAAGVHTMIGLQSNGSPVLAHLRELVNNGFVGEILSVSVVASGFGWGGAIEPCNAYLFDADNGATLFTITGGHMLDALISALGEFEPRSAILVTRREEVAVVPLEDLSRIRAFEATVRIAKADDDLQAGASEIVTRDSFRPTSPDQVLVTGFLGSSPLSLHIRGGFLRASGLLIEVTGSEGELRVTAPAGVLQMMPLTMAGARDTQAVLEPIEIPDDPLLGKREGLSVIAANVATLYARFVEDIRSGMRTVPDFALAARRQRMLADIQLLAS